METQRRNRPVWIMFLAVIAIVFGTLTIKSGGGVLFFDGEARQAAGNYVDFVVWFNFIAGFFYIAAGVGLLLTKKWANSLAQGIAVMTLLTFAAFGVHVGNEGAYEMRTVIAMTIRSALWVVIALATARWFAQVRRTAAL